MRNLVSIKHPKIPCLLQKPKLGALGFCMIFVSTDFFFLLTPRSTSQISLANIFFLVKVGLKGLARTAICNLHTQSLNPEKLRKLPRRKGDLTYQPCHFSAPVPLKLKGMCTRWGPCLLAISNLTSLYEESDKCMEDMKNPCSLCS